jgi:hypothetical protein
VSAPIGSGPRETRPSLYEHALRLHRQHPDAPLPHDGEPYPDCHHHRGRSVPRAPNDERRCGVDAAAVLDGYFARRGAQPAELVAALHDVDVPIHRNEHIVAAALRADRDVVRSTGRWLVRHSTDRWAATIGLALLAVDWAEDDIPLIQTIGLLSNHFGPLAAKALRRRSGGGQALMWLARRVSGWGRVYVVEALCEFAGDDVRNWLLRNACDGNPLNGYFAGRVATSAHLHEAIIDPDADDDLVDHTGRLLRIMTSCSGMGMSLEEYPPARIVLGAHSAHLNRQAPAIDRFVEAAMVAYGLSEVSGPVGAQRELIVRQYVEVLDREDWCDAARGLLNPDHGFADWFVGAVAARLRLRAFID